MKKIQDPTQTVPGIIIASLGVEPEGDGTLSSGVLTVRRTKPQDNCKK